MSSNRTCETVVNFITIVVAYLLLGCVVVIMLPWRLFVWTVAKVCRKDLVGFVTGLSAFLVNLDQLEKPVASIVCFFMVDGGVSISQFCRLVDQRVIQGKVQRGNQRSRLTLGFENFMGYTLWKQEENFRLEEHVREFDYDDLWNGDTIYESDLEVIMAGLLSKPWTKNKSPWEFLLLQNFRGGKENPTQPKMIICLRCHHSIGDGFSLRSLFQDLFHCELPIPVPSERNRQPWWRQIFVPLLCFYHFAGDDIKNRVENHDWQLKESQREYVSTFTRGVPVHEIKEIKNHFNVCYLSVLLTAVSAAVNRFMIESGQVIPTKMKCSLPVPKPDHPSKMTNHAYLQVLLFDTEEHANPDLLKRVDKTIRRKSLAALGSDAFVQLFGLLPKSLFPFVSADVTFGVSLFPVPTKTCYFEGFKISDFLYSIGTFNAGALVSISGFDGLQRIVFNADKSIIESKEAFCKISHYVEEEIEALYAHVHTLKRSEDADRQDYKLCVIDIETGSHDLKCFKFNEAVA